MKDSSIQVLPADKGRTTAITDNRDYEDKAFRKKKTKLSALLQEQNVYDQLKKGPTQMFQNKLSNFSKISNIKGPQMIARIGKFYPTVPDVPRFYGLVKIHKTAQTNRLKYRSGDL